VQISPVPSRIRVSQVSLGLFFQIAEKFPHDRLLLRIHSKKNMRLKNLVSIRTVRNTLIQPLLEGQGGNTLVYDRVLSVVHLDAIQMMCYPDSPFRKTPQCRGQCWERLFDFPNEF
jgi:hypothetical protein